MKKISLSLCVLAALSACGGVDEDDRFVEVPVVTPERTVLIEDFTGQNCVNCPAAHEVLDLLVAQYPDNVIPVSIHAGHFGVAVDRTRYPDYVGLMQPEGDAMADRWGITGYPSGVINRTGGPLDTDKWAEAVRTQLATPSDVGIELEALLDGNDIRITATFIPAADIEGSLNVWVVESGIVAFQRDLTTRIPDYIHNNVYRCSVTPLEGEPLSLTSHVHSTVTLTQPVRHTDTERWDTDHLSVVAFIETPQGVLQAAVTPVVK